MDIKKQSQHLSPAQQYHVLRMQIPVMVSHRPGRQTAPSSPLLRVITPRMLPRINLLLH